MDKKLLLNIQMASKKQPSPDKDILKLTLPVEQLERLDALAKRFGRQSRQAVVYELIKIFLPVWVSVNDSLERAVPVQIEESSQYILEKKGYTSPPDDDDGFYSKDYDPLPPNRPD
jgi:hypothetical protein